ncbi:MAG: hypothetical protein P0Y53_02925 [Candidatus Pseudobacter hemicellulosilyticus]|uniref:Outer membrane protein beta-barrel domain-containing protein n=1 Tax=Candidatus Pseudobacter hemicellulosilyticus TaxID=3121375 RepID=A0AAJ6BHM9_9BACT|nr:MAG: hypothetical protein P0Y53_02925 [Pseudobacter sp.]
MERGFYNDDFEELIKQKADQYKMFPSENVWKGIDRALHTRRKWYWGGFLAFLVGMGYYMMMELMVPSGRKTAESIQPASNPTSPTIKEQYPSNTGLVVPFNTPTRNSKEQQPAAQSADARNFLASLLPDQDFSSEDMETAGLTASVPVTDNAAADATEPPADIVSRELPGLLRPGRPATAGADALEGSFVKHSLPQPRMSIQPASPVKANNLTPAPDHTDALADAGQQEDRQRINWLQEKAVYELTPQPIRRFSWQLAFSPTMNYRKLAGSKGSGESNIRNLPIAANLVGNPDNLVSHKPALGFEAGSHFYLAATKSIRLRAGLQFNYSRYDIQAFTSYTAEQATIALDNANGRHTPDSLTSYTRLRNFGGDKAAELRNQYFQLSTPVGIELRVLGGEKLQLNVAGTIQPTYLLNRNTYLITTDYKNYTKEPSLIRRWNMNTGAEIFVTYKTGDITWQAGPQFRYQLFSSYVKEYPIREYLMEYGIKIGVTKTLR